MALSWPAQGGTALLTALQERPSVPMARGLTLTDRLQSGARVMAWPEHGLVKVEGRLSALVDRDPRTWRLASRGDLLAADAIVRAQLHELVGATPTGPLVAVSRYDLTVEHEFADGAEGQAFLGALRGLCPPRHLVVPWIQRDGLVQSVRYVTERGRVSFRAYDKGLESGSHPAGQRIRLEAQNRPHTRARQAVEVLAQRDLQHDFGRTLAPYLQATEGLNVMAPGGVVAHLAERVEAGELSETRAERLIGAHELLRQYGRAFYADDHKSARRLRALRDAGVAVDDTLPPGGRVPVGELLRHAVEAFR